MPRYVPNLGNTVQTLIKIHWRDPVGPRYYSGVSFTNHPVVGGPVYGRVVDFGEWSSRLNGRGDYSFVLWDGDQSIRRLLKVSGFKVKVDIIRVGVDTSVGFLEWEGILESNISWSEAREELRLTATDFGSVLGDSVSDIIGLELDIEGTTYKPPSTAIGTAHNITGGVCHTVPLKRVSQGQQTTYTMTRVPFYDPDTYSGDVDFYVEDSSAFPTDTNIYIYLGNEPVRGFFDPEDSRRFIIIERPSVQGDLEDYFTPTNVAEDVKHYTHDTGTRVTIAAKPSSPLSEAEEAVYYSVSNVSCEVKAVRIVDGDDRHYYVDPALWTQVTEDDVEYIKFPIDPASVNWKNQPSQERGKIPGLMNYKRVTTRALIETSDEVRLEAIVSNLEPTIPDPESEEEQTLILHHPLHFAAYLAEKAGWKLEGVEEAISFWSPFRVEFSIEGDMSVSDAIEDLALAANCSIDWTLGGRIVPLTNNLYGENTSPDITFTSGQRELDGYEISIPGVQTNQTVWKGHFTDRNGREQERFAVDEYMKAIFGFHLREKDYWMYAHEQPVQANLDFMKYRHRLVPDTITARIATPRAIPGDIIELPNSRRGWVESISCRVEDFIWELEVKSPSMVKGQVQYLSDYDRPMTDSFSESEYEELVPPPSLIPDFLLQPWQEDGDDVDPEVDDYTKYIDLENIEGAVILKPTAKDSIDAYYIYDVPVVDDDDTIVGWEQVAYMTHSRELIEDTVYSENVEDVGPFFSEDEIIEKYGEGEYAEVEIGDHEDTALAASTDDFEVI